MYCVPFFVSVTVLNFFVFFSSKPESQRAYGMIIYYYYKKTIKKKQKQQQNNFILKI